MSRPSRSELLERAGWRELLKGAGCDVKGERVRFPRGLARQIVSTVP